MNQLQKALHIKKKNKQTNQKKKQKTKSGQRNKIGMARLKQKYAMATNTSLNRDEKRAQEQKQTLTNKHKTRFQNKRQVLRDTGRRNVKSGIKRIQTIHYIKLYGHFTLKLGPFGPVGSKFLKSNSWLWYVEADGHCVRSVIRTADFCIYLILFGLNG